MKCQIKCLWKALNTQINIHHIPHSHLKHNHARNAHQSIVSLHLNPCSSSWTFSSPRAVYYIKKLAIQSQITWRNWGFKTSFRKCRNLPVLCPYSLYKKNLLFSCSNRGEHLMCIRNQCFKSHLEHTSIDYSQTFDGIRSRLSKCKVGNCPT